MQSYEQLGLLYLGRRFELSTGARLADPVLYDSKDLVTHAVCMGMTGSGKTGLGIVLIEEAALDGVPVLAIDPKGDLSNLLLTFPGLTAAEFEPWVAPGESASRAADAWRAGLIEWDQDSDRMQRLRSAADVRVYTPGSRAATPLALLKTPAPPDAAGDPEADAARLGATADGVLALAGVSDLSPHSRERALVVALLQHARNTGQSGDLPWLVQQIQKPSIDRVGVLELETFYPARERQELALRLNGVLASPGFDVWLSGEAMDAGRLLYAADGRPRVAIISIAHLNDAERMLVVSRVLNDVLAWTRAQPGTSSLRAMIYMDEIAGYFPPVAAPPSKAPLLTMLKQARAHGVGVVLATQNPVDLDYKGLANAGTWFLGKLQTERDKARVLDGIEGAAAGSVDRAALDRVLSSLRSRVFLLHNVHEPEPVVFQTRWTLSYLRGPLTKDELRRLASTPETPPQSGQAAPSAPLAHGHRPSLPAGVKEFFFPGGGDLEPLLYGSARAAYSDSKRGVNATVEIHVVTPFSPGAVPIDWTQARDVPVAPDALLASPPAGARFAAPPAAAHDPRRYTEWERDFARWIVEERPLRLFSARSVGLSSQPGEPEREFRIRLLQAQHERRDAEVDRLRARYAPRLARLADRVARAEDAVERERQQAGQQKLQSAVSIGATMMGALLGRKVLSASTLGRATTAARGLGRAAKEAGDTARAEERLAEVRQELAAMESELESEVAAIASAPNEPLDAIEIAPKRGAVDVRLVALVWAPIMR